MTANHLGERPAAALYIIKSGHAGTEGADFWLGLPTSYPTRTDLEILQITVTDATIQAERKDEWASTHYSIHLRHADVLEHAELGLIIPF